MKTARFPRRRFNWKALAFFLVVTLVIGFLGGILGGTGGFDTLKKPPLTPPQAVFPIVWTILYVLMAVAAYLVWNANDIDSARVLRLYLVQLVVNALWPVIFFRLDWQLFAFFWILLLIALVTLMMAGFRYINKTAFYLLIPYFLWLLFAAYLNLGFYLLNMA